MAPRPSAVQVVGDRRTLAKTTSLLDNVSHPMHEAVAELESSFSDRLLHRRCTKERYSRSLLTSAVRLYNHQCSQQTEKVVCCCYWHSFSIFCKKPVVLFKHKYTAYCVHLKNIIQLSCTFLWIWVQYFFLMLEIVLTYCTVTVLFFFSLLLCESAHLPLTLLLEHLYFPNKGE